MGIEGFVSQEECLLDIISYVVGVATGNRFDNFRDLKYRIDPINNKIFMSRCVLPPNVDGYGLRLIL